MNDNNGKLALYSAAAAKQARKGPLPGPDLPEAAAQLQGVPMMIEKLEALIMHETDLLRRNGVIDLGDYNYRKSQALLDLTRALRGFQTMPMGQALAEGLKRLSVALEENRAVLKMHMVAVGEIAAIMANELRDAECDGTYAGPGAKSGSPL